MEIYRFSQTEIFAFVLVLVRVSAFFTTWPVFGQGNVPMQVKILLSLLVTAVIFPLIGWRHLDQKAMEDALIWLALKEAFVGVVMGYMVKMFFSAIEICGQLVTDAMGLGNATILNPSMDGRSSVIQEFYVIIATLFFLTLNGHHIFISGLLDSFRLVPLSLVGVKLAVFGEIGAIVRQIIETGIKLGSPVLAAVFLTNVAMAVVGRAVPQINIFVTSLPVNIMIGLVVLMISIPILMGGMGVLLNETAVRVFSFLKEF